MGIAITRSLGQESVRRAFYFWREAGPIVVHYRFTQWWMDASNAPRHHRDAVYHKLHRKYCRPTLDIILNLKGLYVKIGQVLSSRPDFVPAEYVKLFATVQDRMPQWPIEIIETIVTKAFHNELDLDYHAVFESMEPTVLGSASIGQVHRAVLADGRTVAVKVMHPGAKSRFTHDFQVFRWLCRVALPGWRGLVDEIQRQLMKEFDYRKEAQSLHDIRANLQKSPYRKYVRVPEPYLPLCCEHVLVMEMLEGRKLVDEVHDRLALTLGEERAKVLMDARKHAILLGEDDGDAAFVSSLTLRKKLRMLALRRKCKQYVDLLLDVHGRQIFVDGVFNADPHPGNVLVLEDGMLGLIDYGQTRRLANEERLAFARVVIALAQGAGHCEIAEISRQAGFSTKRPDDDTALTNFATFFFDSDDQSRRIGFATPQLYFASLMETNPLEDIPDAAIFIARTSFLFRGMGALMGSKSIRTAHRWLKHAEEAIAMADRATAATNRATREHST